MVYLDLSSGGIYICPGTNKLNSECPYKDVKPPNHPIDYT